MISVTKKQVSLTLLIAVFSTAMIVGSISNATDNNAFATHSKKSHTSQILSQGCNQPTNSFDLTSGTGSRITGSGNNVDVCANLNLGGNAASTDQSNN